MKQLLFLLLFPAYAMAQYPGNANQKITLGEQTTADGLVWRGRLADTANLLTNKLDTSVYIVLDTGTRAMWYYRASTTPKWNRVVDSLNNLQGQLSLTTKVTGVLPVENGGTGSSSFASGNIPFSNGTLLTSDTSLYWNNTNKYLGIGTTNPISNFHISDGNSINLNLVTTDKLTLTYQNIAPGLAGIVAGSAVGNRFVFKGTRSRGTLNSPTVPLENDEVLSFLGAIYDGGNTEGTAQISFVVDGTVGIDTAPQKIGFFTSQFRGVNRLERLTIKSTGNVGIGTTSPTAALHLKAGTATANTAPLKFTSGTNLTTAEAGAMEFNGTNLFFSPSTTRHTVNHGLTGSATLDFPSTTTLLSADLTITVTGAADGDVISLGVPNAAVNANTCYTAWVSAANTVTVRFNNYSSGTVNPASGTFKVFVTK